MHTIYISLYFHMILSLKNIGLHPIFTSSFEKVAPQDAGDLDEVPDDLPLSRGSFGFGPRPLRGSLRRSLRGLGSRKQRVARHWSTPWIPMVDAPLEYSQTIYMSDVYSFGFGRMVVFLEATCLCQKYCIRFCTKTLNIFLPIWIWHDLTGLRLPAPLWIELPLMRSCVWSLPLGRRQTPWKSPGIPWTQRIR